MLCSSAFKPYGATIISAADHARTRQVNEYDGTPRMMVSDRLFKGVWIGDSPGERLRISVIIDIRNAPVIEDLTPFSKYQIPGGRQCPEIQWSKAVGNHAVANNQPASRPDQADSSSDFDPPTAKLPTFLAAQQERKVRLADHQRRAR